jgi:hypothetical protein
MSWSCYVVSLESNCRLRGQQTRVSKSVSRGATPRGGGSEARGRGGRTCGGGRGGVLFSRPIAREDEVMIEHPRFSPAKVPTSAGCELLHAAHLCDRANAQTDSDDVSHIYFALHYLPWAQLTLCNRSTSSSLPHFPNVKSHKNASKYQTCDSAFASIGQSGNIQPSDLGSQTWDRKAHAIEASRYYIPNTHALEALIHTHVRTLAEN